MPSKLYFNPETIISVGSEVGDDVDWSTESTGNSAGQRSDVYTMPTAPRASLYRIKFWCQAVATPAVGQSAAIYLNTGEADAITGHWLNDDGILDGAVSSIDKLANLIYVGAAVCDEAAANIEFVMEAVEMVIVAPFIQFIVWNTLGSAFTTDVAETKLEMTPIPPEIQ